VAVYENENAKSEILKYFNIFISITFFTISVC